MTVIPGEPTDIFSQILAVDTFLLILLPLLYLLPTRFQLRIAIFIMLWCEYIHWWRGIICTFDTLYNDNPIRYRQKYQMLLHLIIIEDVDL